MLDIKTIRDNPQHIRQAIAAKQLADASSKLEQLLLLDEEYRLLRSDLEQQQAERNSNSKRIGESKRRGEDAQELILAMGQLSESVKKLEEKSRSLEQHIAQLLLEIPNPPHSSVPYGASEHDNVVVHERGNIPDYDFEPQPHWELGSAQGWLDLEAGVTIAGSGFPVLKGAGARLQRAMVQYFLNTLGEAGYQEVMPPYLSNADSATATANLPDKEGQMYTVSDGFYLIPTAEVPLTNLHRGQILDEALLPLKYVAHSPCFRREAGSYGKDVRGINRVHQFDKVEMVQLVHPEQSYAILEEMTALSESILSALGLPYRRLLMCSGDMGFAQAKKYDLEVWSPGQQRWLEVSSISNFETFQARRLQTRFRKGGAAGQGKPELVHTLNGSALALPRTLAALVETYQDAQGVVRIPEVLQPYFGSDRL